MKKPILIRSDTVPPVGFEPTIFGLKVRALPGLATEANFYNYLDGEV